MKTFLELVKSHLGESAVGTVLGYHQPNDWIEAAGGYEQFYVVAEGEEITDKTIFIGVELEMGLTRNKPSEEIKAMLKSVMERIPCWFEYDGSIGNCPQTVYQSAELISQPISMKKWLELAPTFKVVCKELADFGFESHNLGTCGLHFHYTVIDRDNKDTIVSRCWHQMHTWEREMHKIAGRSWEYYACDLNCDDAVVPEEKLAIDYLSDKVKTQGSLSTSDQHRIAINLQHPNDIEIRICRGTLNFDTFMARLEFFYNMYVQACSLNVITQRMTWNKLVHTKYIKAYVERHNIATLKKAYDYSTKIQVLLKNISKYDEKIVDCLVDTIRNCKKIANNKDTLNDLRINSELEDILDYMSSALSGMKYRFLKTSSLASRLETYMSTYHYRNNRGKEKMQEVLTPLHKLLKDKPELSINATPERDI